MCRQLNCVNHSDVDICGSPTVQCDGYRLMGCDAVQICIHLPSLASNRFTNLTFGVPYILVTIFYSNPIGCTIFFSLEEFLAEHVSDSTCIHPQDHNCSVQP
jgi:hypothetical protein